MVIRKYMDMSILKVAKMFQKKLVLASNKVVEDMRKVMALASALSSEFDIYDDAYDASRQLAAKAYRVWNIVKNPSGVLPASVISMHLDELKTMAAGLAGMALHPKAQAKLRMLNGALSGVTPVDISPVAAEQGQGIAYPAKPIGSPFLRSPEGKGADPSKLEEVVKGLAPKPLPWSEEAQEPWKK